MAKKWEKVKDCVVKGKKTGVVVREESSGKTRTLLNSHGKYAKATAELESGVRMTNEGKIKVDEKTGKPQTLTSEEKAYRAGYRSAMIDQAKAYNAKNKIGGGK